MGDWIHSGKKTATTRVEGFVFEDGDVQKVAHLRPGDHVRAVDDDENVFGVLEIVKVEQRTLESLDDDLARAENFESAGQLKDVLTGFDPDLTADSELVVVHFKLD